MFVDLSRPYISLSLTSGRFAIADWAAAARAPRLDLRLYAVTDPGCDARRGRTRAQAAAAALAGGATLLQLREKDADGTAFVDAARELVDLAAPHRVRAAKALLPEERKTPNSNGLDCVCGM